MIDQMAAICDDLAAEKAELVGVLTALDAAGWDLATPAEGWAIRDQVGHLAFFDERALEAHLDPAGFLASLAGGGGLTDEHLARGRAMTPPELLAWWDRANRALLDAYRLLDPAARVVWYGPPMAARSKITARIMETWAHGQDIVDALGVARVPTMRLRHVCHVGVRARAFAFSVNGLAAPETDVRVELEAPDGSTWSWGDPEAADRVTGHGLDFALLVTQRRHLEDVAVSAEGPVATRWLEIAQAFAGPPGAGRAPGQFTAP